MFVYVAIRPRCSVRGKVAYDTGRDFRAVRADEGSGLGKRHSTRGSGPIPRPLLRERPLGGAEPRPGLAAGPRTGEGRVPDGLGRERPGRRPLPRTAGPRRPAPRRGTSAPPPRPGPDRMPQPA